MLNAKAPEAMPSLAQRPHLLKIGGRGPKPLDELVVTGLVTITPELAHRIIQTGRFDRQRPVRVKHVDALAMQMRRREWTPGTQIHFARTPDGNIHLVNGQHRMHAVIKADAAIEFQLLVTDIRTDADLIKLYRRHDRLVAPRTVTDALAAEGINKQHDLRVEVANACFQAALLIETGFRSVVQHADPYLKRSDEARLRLCEPWWPIAALFQDAIEKAPTKMPAVKKRLTASGVMAVGLLTLRDQEERADIFWRGIAEDDGLVASDPRKTYLRFLITDTSARAAAMAAKAASLAWNAFYRNEPLSLLRIYKTPVELAGVKRAKPKSDAPTS